MAKNKPNTNAKSNTGSAPAKKVAQPVKPPNQYVLLLACLVITLVCYLPALTNGWTSWDDEGYVYGNDMVKHFSFSNLSHFFSTYQMGNYHPLAMLSLAFDYKLFNNNATGFHIHSLLLHLINVMLVFFFIRLLSNKGWVATITALFFGIHPAHVESVAWISERKDLLYVLYYLAALIAYLKYIKTGRKTLFYGLSIALFVLSLFSKGQAVTLPVALLLIDYYLKRPFNAKVWMEKIPFFLVSFIFGIVAMFAQQQGKAFRFTASYTIINRLFFSAYSSVTYFYKSLVPLKLSAYYPYPLPGGEFGPAILLSAMIFFALLAVVIYSMKKGRTVAFGVGFFFINIVLILQLLPVGGAIMADRYSYLSYVGLFFLMGMGVQWLLDNPRSKYSTYKIPAIALAVACTVFFSIKTFARNHIWKGDEALFTDMLNYSEYIPEANYGLGTEYDKEGKNDLAIQYLTKAAGLTPDYPEPWVRLFYLHSKAGNIDLAAVDYNHLLELERKSNNYHYSPSMLTNLAAASKEQGRANLAVKYFSEAIIQQPDLKELYVGRSDAYRMEGKIDSAIADCNHVLQLDANNADAYVSRGIALCIAGKFDIAMNDFNKAVTLDPKNVKAFGNRGNLFDIKQQYDLAIADYTKALQFDTTYIEVYGNRGRTYIKKGMIDEAIADFTQAILHSPNNPDNYVSRCEAYVKKGNYPLALNDALMAQSKGKPVNQAYLEMLKAKAAAK